MCIAGLLRGGGANGERHAHAHGKAEFHQLWTPSFSRQASDVESRVREEIRMKRRLEEILAEQTGQSLARIARDTERDNFMTPREALEYGLIDEVVARR